VEKTAITTPFGHWEYLVLPMGMANAPSIFMALMNDVFMGMEHFCLVYLDDVLVYWPIALKSMQTTSGWSWLGYANTSFTRSGLSVFSHKRP
jgi:hypothetical protein